MSKYTSKKNFDESSSVDRRYLSSYVFKKLKKTISLQHVNAVISILFEEIITKLIDGEEIVIGKFGKLILKKINPIKHYNYMTGTFETSRGSKKLRFQLHKNVRDFLINKLDIAKTYGNE